MRILQILHNHKHGGAEQHLLQLCGGLRDAGHEVEAAVPRSAWIGQQLVQRGFVVHDFDFRGHYDLKALARLVRLLAIKRYDVVHTHLVRAAKYGHLASRMTGTTMVSSVHDMTTWKNYPRHRLIIAVSGAVKSHLIGRGFAAQNIEVVFPGARDCALGARSDAIRQRVRHDLGLSDHSVAFFLIGRVAEVKGHDVALQAMQRLHAQGHVNYHLFCIGQETAWGRSMVASNLGLNATWLGHRIDIDEWLAGSDICIQPSRSEGLGIALMEAASAGKAVVASDVGGIPEVVDRDVTGLLVPPEDVAALADAMANLACNQERRQIMGSMARRRFEAHFSVSSMVDQTVAVYAASRPIPGT